MDSDTISLIAEKFNNDENQPLVEGYLNMSTSTMFSWCQRGKSTYGISCRDFPLAEIKRPT